MFPSPAGLPARTRRTESYRTFPYLFVVMLTSGLMHAQIDSTGSNSFGIVFGVPHCCNDDPKGSLALPYAGNDAASVRNFFRQRLRASAANLLPSGSTDPDAISMRRSLEIAFHQAAATNVIYVFVSAHGFAASAADPSDGCIVPKGGTLDGGCNSIKTNFLIATLSKFIQLYDNPVVLLLDMSRQGVATGNFINQRLSAEITAWNEPGKRPKPVIALLATSLKEKSYDKKQLGAFAYYLVNTPATASGGLDMRSLFADISRRMADDPDLHGKQHPQMLPASAMAQSGFMPHFERGPYLSASFVPLLYASWHLSPLLFLAAQTQQAEQLKNFEQALSTSEPTQSGGAYDQLRALDPTFRAPELAPERQALVDALERSGQRTIFWYLAADEFSLAPREMKAKAFRSCEAAFSKAVEVARADEGERTDLEGRASFCRGRALLNEYDGPADKQDYLAKAVVELTDSLKQLPKAPEPQNALGLAELERGNQTSAQTFFAAAIQRAPEWTLPRHNEALSFIEVGDYDAALERYDEAIRLAPRYGYLRYNRALLLQRVNRKSEAKKGYGDALQAFDLQIRDLAGWLQDSSERDVALAQQMKQTLHGYEAEAHNALGALYDSQRKWKPALSEYDKALEINPKLLIASHNRGLTLARQRKLDAAIVQWQANLGQDATFIPSRLALARAYFRRNPAEARKQYDAILELQKQDPAAAARTHAEVAKLQYCRADLAGAVQEMRNAIKLKPDAASAAILQTLEAAVARGSTSAGRKHAAVPWSCDQMEF